LILFSVQATPVFAAQVGLTISPTSGPPGTVILLSGSGFAAVSVVAVGFVGGIQTSAGTNGNGAFTDYIEAPTAAPGIYTVSATDGKNTASANFTIGATTGTTTSASTTSSKTSTVTSTVTGKVTSNVTSTVTSTTTSTKTTTSFFTLTTSQPAVTLTATENYTTTAAPEPPVTTTTTVTQPPSPVTVTVSASQSSTEPGSVQSAPQTSGGFSDTSLYFLAGVGILVMAAGVGMLAFRHRSIEDYKRRMPARGKET